MGKTPGKWIKTLLLGKKSSKSSVSKGNEKLKSAHREEPVVSLNDTLSNLSVNPPPALTAAAAINAQNLGGLDNVVAEKLPNDGANISSAKENEGVSMNINLESQTEPGKIKHEQAATRVQAAYRGHQARQTFRNVKCIIRLQAVIRGHLVRRQAFATYSCVWGIVKFQALVRGRKVRCSDIGLEIKKRDMDGKSSETSRVRPKPLMVNPFVQKLLASSTIVLPLRLQYGPGEPNSAWDWLERWTRLQIWSPISQETKNLISKSETRKGNSQTVETKKVRPKQSIRKRPSADAEKPKRNVRVSSHPVQSSKEHPKPEIDKAKQNLRITPNTLKEASDEKPRTSLKKASSSSLSDAPEKPTDSAEKKTDMQDAVSKESDLEKDKKSPFTDHPEQDDMQTPEKNGETEKTPEKNGETENFQGTYVKLSTENDNVNGVSTKASERRTSLPAKIDHQDDGLVNSTRKVPSYMAQTESAKARVRGQGSPRFAQERVEKNGITRRHSLPSSANGKLSTMSPRAQRLVLASGKGSINSDKSLSSSRDATDKMTRAEWKR